MNCGTGHPYTCLIGLSGKGKPMSETQAEAAKKPLFKRWWFWVIVVVVIIGIASASNESKSPSPDATLESITAAYTGSTEAGVELKKDASGLEVTGHYSDGNTKKLSDYAVENPTTLTAAEVATLTISAEGKTCTLDIACSTMSPEQFKESCQPVDYQTIARDPDSWEGKNIVVTGEVIQVQESSRENAYRISITEGEYGLWTDPVYVTYDASGDATRILEDDIVTVYATSTGLYSYTTVLGSEQTIPSMEAKYIDVN